MEQNPFNPQLKISLKKQHQVVVKKNAITTYNNITIYITIDQVLSDAEKKVKIHLQTEVYNKCEPQRFQVFPIT